MILSGPLRDKIETLIEMSADDEGVLDPNARVLGLSLAHALNLADELDVRGDAEGLTYARAFADDIRGRVREGLEVTYK